MTLWAIGVALEALLMLAPLLIAQRLMAGRAEFQRVEADHEARWRASDRADSISLARQREDARTSRSYTVTASGDTLVPLVHLPSGRPDPAVVAALGERSRRSARFLTVVVIGLIPTLLTVVTLAWLLARGSDDGPSRVPSSVRS